MNILKYILPKSYLFLDKLLKTEQLISQSYDLVNGKLQVVLHFQKSRIVIIENRKTCLNYLKIYYNGIELFNISGPSIWKDFLIWKIYNKYYMLAEDVEREWNYYNSCESRNKSNRKILIEEYLK